MNLTGGIFIKFLLMGNVEPPCFTMYVHLNQSIIISKIHFYTVDAHRSLFLSTARVYKLNSGK